MCCLFGLLDYSYSMDSGKKERILSVLSRECEERGTDATGIAYVSRNRLRIFKRPLPAHRMRFHIPEDSPVIMGHTRMATQGNRKYNANNHPFEGRCGNAKFALAHNGVLHNDRILREQHSLPATRIQTDSYVAVQLLEEEKALSFDSLKKMAETVEGSFTFTLLDMENSLYFVKGSSPMCIYHFPKTRFYLYASTEQILWAAVQKLKLSKLPHETVSIQCGDILKIDSRGNISTAAFKATDLYSCFPGFTRSFCYPPYHSCEPHGNPKAQEEDYLEELREYAGYYGYSPDYIDFLYSRGYTCEDIEEIFYGEDILGGF